MLAIVIFAVTIVVEGPDSDLCGEFIAKTKWVRESYFNSHLIVILRRTDLSSKFGFLNFTQYLEFDILPILFLVVFKDDKLQW